MQQERDIITQPKNPNGRIWRYMDLPKLIYVLEKRKLYLSRADYFEDKHEGATPEAQKEWEKQNDPANAESLSHFRRRQREWTFISCWSYSEDESHALWRIFCGPKHGVALCSQYFRLEGLPNPKAEDVRVGLVDYGRTDPIPPNTLVPFFRKRRAFDYEHEARLVANIYRCVDVHDGSGNLLPPRPCLELPLNLSTFVQAIRIHPEADDNYAEVVKLVVAKFAPELMKVVERSELATDPVF